MKITKPDLLKARRHVIEANDYLVLSGRTFHETDWQEAIHSLSDALAIFGYRVEKVLTAQEAHEQALDRRRAEDTADEVLGFR